MSGIKEEVDRDAILAELHGSDDGGESDDDDEEIDVK